MNFPCKQRLSVFRNMTRLPVFINMVSTNKSGHMFYINMRSNMDIHSNLWDGPCVFDFAPPNPNIFSKWKKNTKGQVFPLTKKRLDKPIWLVKEINKLPNDIVRYICLLSVISNEQRWKKNHKRLSWTNIFSKVDMERNLICLPVDAKIWLDTEIWYIPARVIDKTPYFWNRTVCSN